MKFELSEDQLMIRDAVREFAREVVEPRAEEIDRENRFPTELVQRAAELDLCGIVVPERYGGPGLDHIAFAIFVEEIAAVSGTLAVILDVHTSVGTEPIIQFGSEEQKERYLPELASGRILGAFALTEPESGSDAASLGATGVRDGADFVLNGTKTFITNVGHAGLYIVMARTEDQPGARGISAFLVDADTSGVRFGEPMHKMGLRGSATGELILEDVRVPAGNMLGRPGEGFAIAMKALDSGRIGISAQAIGLARGALDYAVNYAKGREQFGQAIVRFEGIQFMIADMATALDAARLMTWQAADACDRGLQFSQLASMAKLFATDTAMKVTIDSVQILGGYGYIKEFPVERMMRDAKATQIYEGTNQIQRIVIARELLKVD
ncbi:MAG TPA: acyl-CoA dehydrogenase [Chloroflexi bacterium]|jgi:alkylation response protein AidB-like acyl-CoA dehydrogenase|nr:acyl-CoA dehydrogenase [Chloroflexota bacterium]